MVSGREKWSCPRVLAVQTSVGVLTRHFIWPSSHACLVKKVLTNLWLLKVSVTCTINLHKAASWWRYAWNRNPFSFILLMLEPPDHSMLTSCHPSVTLYTSTVWSVGGIFVYRLASYHYLSKLTAFFSLFIFLSGSLPASHFLPLLFLKMSSFFLIKKASVILGLKVTYKKKSLKCSYLWGVHF